MEKDGTEAAGGRLGYLPGLDGLRALAVVAVLLYHADVGLAGGFLGVESFFVISGFLITALLLAERRQHGRIDLAAFWLRRARRLLPALLLVLAATLALVGLWLPDDLPALASDLPPALGYLMNWHLILGARSYFDPMVRPSLVQHLWSLAIEEQFYLIWPLLLVIGLRFLRPRALLALVLAATLGSAAWMAWLYQPGADPSRLYYGSDTRASGLLLGVALAFVLHDRGGLSKSGQSARGLPAVDCRQPTVSGWVDVAGGLALLGLLAAYVWLYEAHPWLYRGGFTLAAALTAAAIVGATHPAARLLPRALGWAPLRWIGLRSYGIYLWHWPVFMLTRPYQDVPLDGWPLLALRVAVVLLLASLSYRYVEAPIRGGALAPVWRALASAWRPRPARGRWWLRRPGVPILGAVLLFTAACSLPGAAAPITPAPSPAAPAPAATLPATQAAGADTAVPAQPTALAAPASAVPAATAGPPTAEPSKLPTAAPATATPAPVDQELAAALQEVLDDLTASGAIPGAVLAVSIPGYETWVGASGVRDRKSGDPIAPDTRMRIASISKVFTAVVALQLLEEGKLELDAPLATYLPGLLRSGDKITVRNLLQHTSGLYDYLEDRTMVNRAYRDAEKRWEPRELVEYAAKFPLAFQPGASGAWDYSSTNYVILGMLVEQVTGNSLAAEMRGRIFEPLELDATFFAPDEPVVGVQSRGYSNNVDQTAVAMSFAYATANLVSTASDLQRFAQGLFGGQLLRSETLALMQTFVDGKGQYKMPELAYGLGLMRNQLPAGPAAGGQARTADETTVLGHIGGFGGFRSALWHAPASGVTIALGVNQAATDPNILATRAFDTVLTHLGR
jgi:peptidoglycan/LPS O-acetylase OafA/YrhL/CubicO group peptidase (beta-lactamase class C family)